jgi:uncharacterized protein (DUF1684 family)
MKRSTATALVLLSLIACSPAPPPPPPPPDPAHVQEVEAWRAKRDARLRSEDGWLTLVGLAWLKEGDNRFGSAADNEVPLPASVAAQAGKLTVAGETVTLHPEPGAGVKIGDRDATSVVLVSDKDGADPTMVHVGSVSFYVIVREGKLAVRAKDSESPVRKSFTGMEYFPIDPKWRVTARFEPYSPEKVIPVPNVFGRLEDSKSPGALVFEMDGNTYRLDPVWEEGTTDLFIIFGDQTNGHETYGAGRFLYAHPAGPDGTTVVDFNKAYNPPCVFTPFATCPLPPPQNKLAVRVLAGEKRYAHEVAHSQPPKPSKP